MKTLPLNPGRITTTFSHDQKFDYINLRIEVQGAVSFTHDHDDVRNFRYKKGETIFYPDLYNDLTVYMSSVWCPFKGFIKFLEEVADHKDSKIEWDPEGPFGELAWEVIDCSKGIFNLTWICNKDEISYRIYLSTKQFVGMLYTSFRRFVESPKYDPIRYERLNAGEAFSLILSEPEPLKAIEDKLVQMNRTEAEQLVFSLCDCIQVRSCEGHQQHTLEHCIKESHAIDLSELGYDWIPHDWDSMTESQRRIEITGEKGIYKGGVMSWDGANLRTLKSASIERYIAP